MLRIPHHLDSRLKDVVKVVSPTHRPHCISQKHYFSASGTHLSEPQGLVGSEGLLNSRLTDGVKVVSPTHWPH
jgi:hypothetical protein